MTFHPSYKSLEEYIYSSESAESLLIKKHLITCDTCEYIVKILKSNPNSIDPNQTQNEDFREVVAGCLLLQLLGKGSMGEVYKAIKLSLNRIVAVKIISDPKHLGHPERFRREALALAQVDHPHIAKIYDFAISEDQTKFYLVMQYIDGEILEHYVRRTFPLPLEKQLIFCVEMLLSVYALHQANILHRDIKAENIMVDTKDNLVLIDFGLAKFFSKDVSDLTTFGTVLGTPRYMSPEACRGELQNYSSDIYSLGIVFYFLFSGNFPFKSENILGLIEQHLHKEAVPLSDIVDGFPQELSKIVQKMIEKSLDFRYSHCLQIVDEILFFMEKKNLLFEWRQKLKQFIPNKNILGMGNEEKTHKIVPIFLEKSFSLGNEDKTIIVSTPPKKSTLKTFLFQPVAKKEELKNKTTQKTPTLKTFLLKNSSENTTTPKFEAKSFEPLLRQKKLLENRGKQLVSFSRKLVTSQSSQASNSSKCSCCREWLYPEKLFSCQRCGQFVCLKHIKGYFFCETCFLKLHGHLPIYKKLKENDFLQAVEEEKVPTTGEASFIALKSIFATLCFERHPDGLLVLENVQGGKAFSFLQNKVQMIFSGSQNKTKLGKILVLCGFITTAHLETALKLQEKSSEKLGKVLISLKALSLENLEKGLLYQLRSEFLWNILGKGNCYYKFKLGEVPPSLLRGKPMEIELELAYPTQLKLFFSRISAFLANFFQPGLFILEISLEKRIGFLITFERQLQFVQLLEDESQSRIPFFFEASAETNSLVAQKQMYSRMENISQSLEDIFEEIFLAREEISYYLLEEDQVRYKAIGNPFDFLPILIKCVSMLEEVPALLTRNEIFENILEKKSSIQIVDDFYLYLKQSLKLESLVNFSELEQLVLRLFFLKSHYTNYFKLLKSYSIYCSKNNMSRESSLALEAILELSTIR